MYISTTILNATDHGDTPAMMVGVISLSAVDAIYQAFGNYALSITTSLEKIDLLTFRP